MKLHLTPIGKPAPPRPRMFAFFASSTTCSRVIVVSDAPRRLVAAELALVGGERPALGLAVGARQVVGALEHRRCRLGVVALQLALEQPVEDLVDALAA